MRAIRSQGSSSWPNLIEPRSRRPDGGALPLSILRWLFTLALPFAIAACSSQDMANNTMNVDENVTMDMNATADMNASDINNDIASEAGQGLPEFKIPAPRASAQMVLPRSILPAGSPNLELVGDRLRSQLAAAGYGNLGYYRVTNGFALATGMERVGPDGRPVQGAKRWATEATGLASLSSSFTLASLIRSLVNADPGSYRVMIFVVTNRPVTNSTADMKADTAKVLVVNGASDLPEGFSQARFGPDYRVTALIYEFNRTAVGKPAEFSRPSTRTAADQLRLAKILNG